MLISLLKIKELKYASIYLIAVLEKVEISFEGGGCIEGKKWIGVEKQLKRFIWKSCKRNDKMG